MLGLRQTWGHLIPNLLENGIIRNNENSALKKIRVEVYLFHFVLIFSIFKRYIVENHLFALLFFLVVPYLRYMTMLI